LLKRQLLRNEVAVDPLLISQQSGGRFYTEREIHKFAHSERIIDDDLYNEIGALYENRNAIIHRFFLTDIQYVDLRPALRDYERVYGRLYHIVYELEREQIRLGVGMTQKASGDADEAGVLEDV